jgi:peptide/nickel transport system permease protein
LRLWHYTLQRLGIALLLLAGASIVLFLMLRLLPGDPTRAILGLRYSPEAAAVIEARLGLDRSLPEQYLLWIGPALRGDLGNDYRSNRPVSTLLRQRLPVTLQLTAMAMLVAVTLALAIGLLVTVFPRRPNPALAEGFSIVGMSVPEFALGILLILLFAEHLRWLPPSGYVDPATDLVGNLRRMVLPSVTLSVGLGAVLLRFVQGGLASAMAEDYVRTARARGVPRFMLVWKHALRNASLPIVTVVGLQVGYLFGGAVIVEEIFSLPGVGRLIVSAVTDRNYLVAQSAILVVVALFVFVTFVVDVLYGLLDPRIRG